MKHQLKLDSDLNALNSHIQNILSVHTITHIFQAHMEQPKDRSYSHIIKFNKFKNTEII